MRRSDILLAIFIFGMLAAVIWQWTDRPLHRQSAAVAPAGQTNAAIHQVDLNTADEAELQLLPGIGPGLAARIVADRQSNGPFNSIDDLERVTGIGPKRLEAVAPWITCRPAQ